MEIINCFSEIRTLCYLVEMSDYSDSDRSSVSAASPSRESTPEPDTTQGSGNKASDADAGSSVGSASPPPPDDQVNKESDKEPLSGDEDEDVVGDSETRRKRKISDDDDERVEDENEKEGADGNDTELPDKETEGNEDANETHDSDEAGPSKRRRVVMSSDDEEDDVDASSPKRDDADSDGEQGEVGVGELMTNIFGEESDDEDLGNNERNAEEPAGEVGEESPRPLRDEEDEDDGRQWDFDVMLQEKKAERKKMMSKRKRKDGSIYVGGEMDEQIKEMIDTMKAAATKDRHCNIERKPALHKRKMLKQVKTLLIKHDCMEAIIDNGMMNAVSEWLAPLPDKSLPALEIRTELLKILQGYRLEPGTLKQSGLGRAIMLLYKHPRETKENKILASKLISEWSRPIFQLETDFSTMTKDERIQRDYAQQPEMKKRRPSTDGHDAEKDSEPRPGDKGFIIRARVPKPSQKDYVVRPKSNVEGQFHGPTKNRQNARFEKAQREFKERNKQTKNMRAMKVSIEGRRMDI